MALYAYRQGKYVAILDTYPRGLTEMVCADFLVENFRARAEAARSRAQAIAPKGRRGIYRSSFEVTAGVAPSSKGHRRAYAKLANNARYAIYVEWGNNNIAPHRVLRRAVGQRDFSGDKFTPKGSRPRGKR